MAMRFALIVATLLAKCAAESAAPVMNLFKLTDFPDAVCLDGTPAGYYYSPGSGAHTNDWILFFEGGGWCYSEADCWGRSKTRLGSSANWTESIPCDGGPLSCSCTDNSLFCEYNKVYMFYCDGDSFAGNRDDPIVYNGDKLFFRGHRILEATLQSLYKLPNGGGQNWAQAKSVLLSGCSAGGLATYLHADFVAENVPSTVTKYGAMPISGFFLRHNNTQNVPVYPDEMQVTFALANASSGVDADCINYMPPEDAWKCNFAQYTYEFVKSRIFPLNSKYDSWQAACILTSEPVPANSTENGHCSAVAGWSGCIGSLESCTAQQVTTLGSYGVDFLAIMNASATAARPGNGGFIDSCLKHCELVGAWNQISINGVTAQDAVRAWWDGPANAPAENNWHHDCSLHATKPYACNPSCDQSFKVPDYAQF